MDAPNAPNPANPNVQDQDADAEQGPANQAQGPTVQNQAQGPTVQNPAQGPTNQNQTQGPAAQVPAQGPVQVGQNIPIQPPKQAVPIQLVPAGVVVPTPQKVYQNWIGKKPEFAGKPEEDAESHLLSKRDWIEAYNFPNELKLDAFVWLW